MKLRPVIRLCRAWPALLLLIAGLPVWARSYHVTRFHSDIHLDDNGSAGVTETFTFAFKGQFQGICRNIPVEYPGPGSTNYSLFIKVDRVTGENRVALKYEKHTTNGYLKLKIFVPGALNTNRTPRSSSSSSSSGWSDGRFSSGGFPVAPSAVVEAEHFSCRGNTTCLCMPQQSPASHEGGWPRFLAQQ